MEPTDRESHPSANLAGLGLAPGQPDQRIRLKIGANGIGVAPIRDVVEVVIGSQHGHVVDDRVGGTGWTYDRARS